MGFYSTGPKIKPTDLAIDTLFREYHPHPALVIIDVRPDVEGIPVQAYVSVDTVSEVRPARRPRLLLVRVARLVVMR